MRPAHERRGEQRIAGAGVPKEQEIGAAPQVRIALDLEAEAEEPDHRPEERRSPPGLEPEVDVHPSFGVDTEDGLPRPQPGARGQSQDLARQVDGHDGSASERNAATAPHQIDDDRQREPDRGRSQPHEPGDHVSGNGDEAA